ncbi:MAG: hypothetical protein K1Y01_01285 [Vicinamibacteria bacterium]|nr:hypothetical protein [Vicinamibacteria bacterium]
MGGPEGAREASLIREQIGSRVEQLLATLAQRAAETSGIMALGEGSAPSPSFRRGLVVGLGLPQDTPLVDDLSSEFFTWLVDDCHGRAMTPWGVLQGKADGVTLHCDSVGRPQASAWQRARRIAYKDPEPAPISAAPALAFGRLLAAAAEDGPAGETDVAPRAPRPRDQIIADLTDLSDEIEKPKGSL